MKLNKRQIAYKYGLIEDITNNEHHDIELDLTEQDALDNIEYATHFDQLLDNINDLKEYTKNEIIKNHCNLTINLLKRSK